MLISISFIPPKRPGKIAFKKFEDKNRVSISFVLLFFQDAEKDNLTLALFTQY